MGRPSKKKSTDEIIRDAVRETAKVTAEEVVQSLQGADSELENEPTDTSIQGLFQPSSHADIEAQEVEKDVFATAAKLVRDGRPCYLEIRKNGNYVGTEYPPFTIQDLTKKYCKFREMTHFKVIVKDTEHSRIVTYQNLRVEKMDKDDVVQEAAPVAQFTPETMARIVTDAQERTKKDIMEMLSPQLNAPRGPQLSDQLVEIAKIITPLLVGQKKDDGLKDLISEMRLSNERMQNALDRKLDKMEAEIREAKKPAESFGPKEILTLQREAREEGYEFFKNMRETIESIAEKKAVEKDDDDEPTDWIGKLIASGTKLLDATMKENAGREARYPSYRQIEKRASPQASRPVPRAASVPSRPKAATAPKQAAPESAAASAAQQPPIVPSGEEGGLMSRVVSEDTSTVEPGLKEKVLELLTPAIGESLLESQDAEGCATKVKAILTTNGIPLDAALNSVTLDDVLKTAHSNGVPEAADQWLGNLYDTLMEDDGQKEHSLVSNA